MMRGLASGASRGRSPTCIYIFLYYIVVRGFCDFSRPFPPISHPIAAPLNNAKLRVFTRYFEIRVWRIAAPQPPMRPPISRPLLIYRLHVIQNCKLYSYICCQSFLWFQQPLTAAPPAENLYFLDWTLNFCFYMVGCWLLLSLALKL